MPAQNRQTLTFVLRYGRQLWKHSFYQLWRAIIYLQHLLLPYLVN
jgi:hypothetical protein